MSMHHAAPSPISARNNSSVHVRFSINQQQQIELSITTNVCELSFALPEVWVRFGLRLIVGAGPCDFGLRGVRGDPTRRHQVAAREPQHETPGLIGVRRVEAYHFTRNCSLDFELVRLVIGACHQRHAADAGRNAEIILDARRRAGLTAGRTAIQHQNGGALGSRVDRSRKARHPR